MEDFNEWDHQDLSDAKCPNCSEPVPDVENGGDPASWWNTDNIPECNLKHKCNECDQEFRVSVNWTPKFTMIPIEHDHDFDNDYSVLDEA